MYKEQGKKHTDYVYALFAKREDGKEYLMVMNNCVPVFADVETAQDFMMSMVDGRFDKNVTITYKKVVINEYVENKGKSDREGKPKTKRSDKVRDRGDRKSKNKR